MASTPEGKEVSRLNAMKHSLSATDEIFVASLKGYDKTRFTSIRDELHENYRPQTVEEQNIVDRMAIQYFRQYRLYKFENLAAQESHEDLVSSRSVLHHLDRFSRYDARIERQLRRLHNQLHDLYWKRKDFSLNYISPKN